MEEEDIQELISRGWWVSVSPVNSEGKWKFTCGIYKKYEKSGNWVTDNCKSFTTPQQCYDWARKTLEKQIFKKSKTKNKNYEKL
tara:strand:+ start:191 stop:442 length:252 start_codon:yes stop_codon:yes gene_type:complete